MVVNYIEMNPIGIGRSHITDLFAKTVEVCRQLAGSNTVSHNSLPLYLEWY